MVVSLGKGGMVEDIQEDSGGRKMGSVALDAIEGLIWKPYLSSSFLAFRH